jgi:hypothetical protein
VPSDYASAALTGGQTVIYNNNSGNWRFDNITFSGSASAVPEPASFVLVGLGFAAILVGRRQSRRM